MLNDLIPAVLIISYFFLCRRSFGSSGAPVQHSNNNNIIKRRSHSDTVLSRTDQIEIPVIHTMSAESTNDVQAKVPKLEIRSPILGLPIPLSNSFPFSDTSGSLNSFSANNRGHTISSSQRRSTFSSHTKIPQPSSKRSRSSENLNSVQLLTPNKSQLKPASPFSFSLTTPNTSLFSFKSYGKGSNSLAPGGSKSRSLTSSPTSLLYPSAAKR